MSVQQATDIVRLNVIEYRMAILWFFLFSINSLCSALMIALANVTWVTLDFQGKFMIVVALIWNWTTTIMAFLSAQAKRIKKTGDLFPIGEDDTQRFTKTDQTTQVTQITTK